MRTVTAKAINKGITAHKGEVPSVRLKPKTYGHGEGLSGKRGMGNNVV